MYIFILVQRFRNPSCYNKSIGYCQLVCDSTLLWITFCVAVHAFLDDYDNIDSTGLFYAIFGSIMVGGGVVMLIE
jgi:hypothetical protein